MLEYVVEEVENTLQNYRKLDDLPGEILSMISGYLTNKQLREFRKIGSRHIAQHIDHTFAQAHFHHRVCKTTNRSIGNLERLNIPRFVKHIHTLEIRLDLGSHIRQLGEEGTTTLDGLVTLEILNEARLFAVLESIFKQALQLRELIIRAPEGQVYTKDGNLMARRLPEDYEDMCDGELGGLLILHSGQHPSTRANAICDFVFQLVRCTQTAAPCLEVLRILDFAKSEWQSWLASAESILEGMAYFPVLQNLTTIDLQLEMFPSSENICMLNLVEITKQNPNLEVLRIRTSPRSIRYYRTSSEIWAPLLQQLGSDPPFRLRTLEFDGLISSESAPTLDRIVDTHSPTLRRLVLQHTNFHHPNTLHALFSSLANSNVNYFESNWLYLHRGYYLLASRVYFQMIFDEVMEPIFLHAHECNDESCWDWVEVFWDVSSFDTPVVFDNEDGWHGEGWMKHWFMNTVASINCGAIRDY
ncbi:hypothetical protein J3E71DRAFT_344720 [Bipolaris maydis]|nr:hypothetical protein J3E71DRAFT_344720 [Bipolaris maydis]